MLILFAISSGVGPLYFLSKVYRSRTSLVGKVDDSESGGPRFESRHGHLRKNLLVLLDKALYLRLSWIMTTFCPSIISMEIIAQTYIKTH